MPLYDVLIMATTAGKWETFQVVDVFPAGQLDITTQPDCFDLACAIEHPGTLDDIKAELIRPSEEYRNEISIDTALQTQRYKDGMNTQKNPDKNNWRRADEDWLNFVLTVRGQSKSVREIQKESR